MSDRPDYTLPVSIEAITIESLPVDIIAQTVGSIAIDIAAQTLGEIDVNIKAQDSDINVNIAAQDADLTVNVSTGVVATRNDPLLINGAFERYDDSAGTTLVQFEGWTCVLLGRNLNDFHSGAVSCTIWYSFSYLAQTLDVPCEVTYVKELSFFGWGRGAETKITLLVTYTDGNTDDHEFTCPSNTWTYCDITSYLTAGKSIREVKITVDAASCIDDMTLIVYRPIGDILSTIDINIESQDVEININTAGGANIVIDKLTQTAYTEERRTIENHGISANWDDPTGDEYRGKFFPRGCRGFIDTIDVYCKDSGASGGTITVYISPFPGMGYIYTADVTVPASGGDGWRSANFDKMWNYDSMFIFISQSSDEMNHGFEATTPYDGYTSSDAGVTWAAEDQRRVFRIIMKGQTIGDIPISGIVNNVPIRASAGLLDKALSDVAGQAEEEMISINGAGQMNSMFIWFYQLLGTVNEQQQKLKIVTDGVSFEISMYTLTQLLEDAEKTPTDITFQKIDLANHIFKFNWRVPIPFQRSLKIICKNTAAANGNEIRHQGIFMYELTK